MDDIRALEDKTKKELDEVGVLGKSTFEKGSNME